MSTCVGAWLIINTETTDLLTKQLSLQPLDGSDVVVNTTTHELKLYGKTVSGGRVAVKVRMAYSSKQGVALKVVARSEEEGLARGLVDGIA